MLLNKSLFNFRARLQPVSSLSTKYLAAPRAIIDVPHNVAYLTKYTFAFLLLLLSFSSFAQTIIQTTTYTGNGTGSGSPGTGISVNVINTNPYAVIVTQFGYSPTSAVPTELWFSSTSITGTCGAVNSSNPAWTLAQTIPSPTTVTNTTIVDNFFSGLNVTIPPGMNYRFVIVAVGGSARYSAASAPSPTTWTTGGVTLDATTSYWGGSGSVGNTGRYFYGSVTFINACVGTTTLNTSNITMSSASANWNAVTGSLGYEYAITTSPTPPSSGTATATTSANFTGLTINTTYYVHVRNKCTASFSNWQTTSFTTLNAYCLPPNNILFSDITMTSADILWSKMPTTDYYQYNIDITKNITHPSPNTKNTTGINAAATGLQPFTKYYVQVRSICLGGNDSSTWKLDSFITKSSCEKPVVSITNPGDNPTASWPAIPAAVAYEYRVTNDVKEPAFGTEIFTTSVNINLPADGISKYLYVRTKCNSQFVFSPWVMVPLRMFANSVNNMNNGKGIMAYPNPVKDLVTLEIKGYDGTGGSITIIDMTGKTVRTLPVESNKIILDMQGLASGIYTVKYTGTASSEVLRITKQ